MKFDKGDVWRPPHCEFIGVYRYEPERHHSTPDEDISGYVPDYRDHVPANVPFFAIVRENDGFTDTATGDELAYSVQAHGYDYAIVRRRPEGVEPVSEDEFYGVAEELFEEGYSEEEADQIASEQIGYNPHRTEDTTLVFYWPAT